MSRNSRRPVEKLSMTVTSSPRSISPATRLDPIKPAPPVTITLIGPILTPTTGGAVSDSILQHVKLFADGADLDGILALYADPTIRGFTTNPTLMRQAGIDDYESLRPRPPGRGARSAHLPGGVRRRRGRHGAPGRQDRIVGRERLREDPGHQHAARVHGPAPSAARGRGREGERDRDDDGRAGRAGTGVHRRRAAGVCVRVRRSRRRHRSRSDPDHARRRCACSRRTPTSS